MPPVLVPPGKRFVAALESLLRVAERQAAGEVEDAGLVTERRWALELARRSLAEAGGPGGLDAADRRRSDDLAARILRLDQRILPGLRSRCDRLRHGLAERRGRAAGGLARGALTDRAG